MDTSEADFCFRIEKQVKTFGIKSPQKVKLAGYRYLLPSSQWNAGTKKKKQS